MEEPDHMADRLHYIQMVHDNRHPGRKHTSRHGSGDCTLHSGR